MHDAPRSNGRREMDSSIPAMIPDWKIGKGYPDSIPSKESDDMPHAQKREEMVVFPKHFTVAYEVVINPARIAPSCRFRTCGPEATDTGPVRATAPGTRQEVVKCLLHPSAIVRKADSG